MINRKLKQCYVGCLYAFAVLGLSACGGGSSGSGDTPDSSGTGSGDSSQSVIVPLSSLGPLSGRLYPAGSNRQPITGPNIGSDLAPISDLLREITFEVGTKIQELEVEVAYIMRELKVDSFDGSQLSSGVDPAYYMVAVVTNVSNRMVCDIRLRDVQLESVAGETSNPGTSPLFGYLTRSAATDNYEQDCIPPGLSAYAMEFVLGPTVFEAEFSFEDPGKFIIGEITGNILDSQELFSDGLYASSYVADPNATYDHRYGVTIVNPASRNFDQSILREGIVFLIDAETGVPIATEEFSNFSDRPAHPDVFAPGDEFQFQFEVGAGHSLFAGSTNSIFVWIDYIEEGN